MSGENKKDFNRMLHDGKDMPRIQTITDPASIQKYGGARMYFAPPIDYDRAMRRVPFGRVTTVGELRARFARESGADFTDPITAGIFVSITAWACEQRGDGSTPWWRTLKADGELNPKYPGGTALQREKLEAEGHRIVARGRKNIRYYVEDWQNVLAEWEQ